MNTTVSIIKQGEAGMDDQWPDWTNLILGFWLLMTPWLFGGDDLSYSQSLNFWIAGGLIMGCSVIALSRPRGWLEGLNFCLGIWLAVSAGYVFDGDSRIEVATVLVGIAIGYLCLLSLWHFRLARLGKAKV